MKKKENFKEGIEFCKDEVNFIRKVSLKKTDIIYIPFNVSGFKNDGKDRNRIEEIVNYFEYELSPNKCIGISKHNHLNLFKNI